MNERIALITGCANTNVKLGILTWETELVSFKQFLTDCLVNPHFDDYIQVQLGNFHGESDKPITYRVYFGVLPTPTDHLYNSVLEELFNILCELRDGNGPSDGRWFKWDHVKCDK